jgi:hypothetical protein
MKRFTGNESRSLLLILLSESNYRNSQITLAENRRIPNAPNDQLIFIQG